MAKQAADTDTPMDLPGFHNLRYDARNRSGTGLVFHLYTYGYLPDTVFKMFRLLDWMIRLPTELEPVFAKDMRRIEAEDAMTYVTSLERVGEQRGRQMERTDMLRRQLSRKFGPLPEWVDTQLANANDEQMLLWVDSVLDETSLQAVFA